jgi:hypothetical protein
MNKIWILFVCVLSFYVVSAEVCNPSITLLNQDPYPANPGEYVRIVFQVSNIDNSECGDINFRLLEGYPIVFDPNENGIRIFRRVDYMRDFSSSIMIPYRVRVDPNAIDGSGEIEVQIQAGRVGPILKRFDLEIKDMSPSFEVFVEDYDPSRNQITFQILNTGNINVQALAIQVPRQENIVIKGSNRVIVGDLDSNEYTTATFEAQPKKGDIRLMIHYTDENNVRRSIEEFSEYDPDYFENKFNGSRSASSVVFSVFIIVFLLLLILLMVFFAFKIVKAIFVRKPSR